LTKTFRTVMAPNLRRKYNNQVHDHVNPHQFLVYVPPPSSRLVGLRRTGNVFLNRHFMVKTHPDFHPDLRQPGGFGAALAHRRDARGAAQGFPRGPGGRVRASCRRGTQLQRPVQELRRWLVLRVAHETQKGVLLRHHVERVSQHRDEATLAKDASALRVDAR